MNSEKTYVLAILAMSWLVFVAFAGSFHPDFLVPLFDWGQSAPAWVQAIGSIVAIAVALYVPFRLHANSERRDAQQRHVRSKALALIIGPAVEGLCEQTIARVARIQKAIAEMAHPLPITGCFYVIANNEIPSVHESLQARVDQLYLLDPKVSDPLIELLAYLPVFEMHRKDILGRYHNLPDTTEVVAFLKEFSEKSELLTILAKSVQVWFPVLRDGTEGAIERISALLEQEAGE